MGNLKQPVQGGKLLDSIVKMLFGEVTGILDRAAEYEEDMGVLKQVTRIPIKSENGKSYTLKITLSPVKNKKNTYYVETETDAPGFDVSMLNDKVIELDNSNMKQFNQKVDELLEKNNLKAEKGQESDSNDEESSDLSDADDEETDSNDSEPDNVELKQQVESLVNEVIKEVNKKDILAKDPNGYYVRLVVEIDNDNSIDTIYASITGYGVYDDSNKIIIKPEEFELSPFASGDDVKSVDEFKGELTELVLDFADDNNLSNVQFVPQVNASIQINVRKSKNTGKLKLAAVKASSMCMTAPAILGDVLCDNDFIDSIPVDCDKSYEITDEGECYNIEEIESVDNAAEETYKALFILSSKLYNRLQSIKWALGEISWSSRSNLNALWWVIDTLKDDCGKLVAINTNCYPYAPALEPFESEFVDYADFKSEDGKLDADKLEISFMKSLKATVDLLEMYYINIKHEEQCLIDNALRQMKSILAFV